MQIKSESEILNQDTRKAIIDEILGSENLTRKDNAYKRYQCYKDRIIDYVIEKMLMWFDWDTVREMSYATANISLVRKIVDKLARVYSQGVQRTVYRDDILDPEATQTVEKLAKILDFDSAMKKENRFFKLDKNGAVYVRPIQESDGKYCLKVQPLCPFLYDVVESAEDREKPLVYILSQYHPRKRSYPDINTAEQAKTHGSIPQQIMAKGDGKDQRIADSPDDQDIDKEQFVWWSDTYHFTTNKAGEIISQGDNLNPIGECPIVSFAIDQDGSFWAQGGDDLVDGAVLINSVLSHTMHIGVIQGYGQFYATGRNLPSSIKLGPNKGIKIEYDKDNDPVPDLGFLQANPPLDQLRSLVEMYTALLLTSNNLSTSGVAVQLGTVQSAASGVAIMLDKSESMEDVTDQAQIFKDREGEIWEIVGKWLDVYGQAGLLSEDLMGLSLPPDFDVQLKFPDQRPLLTESEKLDALQKRKDLGISLPWELIQLDDPSLSADQAKEKLMEIMAARGAGMKAITTSVTEPKATTTDQGAMPGEDSQSGGDTEQDVLGT